ncbi:MAG: hypothetical protein ACTHM8_12520 [Sphingomonas sp.]
MTPDRASAAAAAARSAALAKQWRDGAVIRDLAARFAGLGEDPDVLAERAHALLADDGWVRALIEPGIAALADDPWVQPPLAVSRDAMKTGAVLFDAGSIVITASVTAAEGAAAPSSPRSVIVPGRLTVVRYVKSGGARLQLWRAPPAGSDFNAAEAKPATPLGALPLGDGVVLRLDGRTRGWWIEGATSDVVTLTATIRAGQAPLMRDYAVPSGTFLRCATLDERAARAQMLLTFLRVEGRREAGDRFEAASRDPASFLRWSAMREWLALDALAALPRLREMAAGDPSGDVRGVATQTLVMVEAKRKGRACRA